MTKKFKISLGYMKVQEDAILPQWQRFKAKIRKEKNLAKLSYDDMWDWMFAHNSDTMKPTHYYDMLCLVALVRCWMFDTACCERGFSIMNLLRTALRNRLSERLCRVLMTINLIGGEDYKHPGTVPVERIYEEWKGMKKRRNREPNDGDIYGQHEWAALMGRLRKLQEESHMF